MTAKSLIKLVFFFFIIERVIAFLAKLPLLEQVYHTIMLSPHASYSSQALRFALLGPVLDLVIIAALIILVKNERLLNKLSAWLAK